MSIIVTETPKNYEISPHILRDHELIDQVGQVDELSSNELGQLEQLENPDAPKQRQFDCDKEMQRNLLGLLLTVPEVASEFVGIIDPKSFTDIAHQHIAKILTDFWTKYHELPDREIIVKELKDKYLQDKKDDIKARYFGELATAMTYCPTENGDFYRDQLRSFENTKKMQRLHKEMFVQMKAGKPDFKKAEEYLRLAMGKKPISVDRKFVDANEILLLPDPTWLVDGILPEKCLAMIYGLPGGYKTFFALEMILSLAHGVDVLDRFKSVAEIPVAYLSPEGTSGLKLRLRAWMDAHEITKLRNTVIARYAWPLNETEEMQDMVRKLAATAIKPKVLVIDTLARNFSGDENSTKEMSNFANNCAEIGKELEIAIIIVHHSGKDIAKGPRGSISLLGAVDTAIEVSKADGIATIRCRKQKDGDEFDAFDVTPTKTGQSIVLKYAGETKAKAEKPERYSEAFATIRYLPVDQATAVDRKQLATASGGSERTIRRHLELAIAKQWAGELPGRPLKYYLTNSGSDEITNWNQETQIVISSLSS